MDYVQRCDLIARAIAEAVEVEPNQRRFIHPQNLSQYLIRDLAPPIPGSENAVVMDAVHVLKTFTDWDGRSMRISFADIAALKDPHARWMQVAQVTANMTADQKLLLATLNELSEREVGGVPSLEYVDLNAITVAFNGRHNDSPIDRMVVAEELDGFAQYGLADPLKHIDMWRYRSTYDGLARITRDWAADDLEIDEFASVPEGDTLDRKRIYDIATADQKRRFAKIVTAMANAGGTDDRYILVGVEDDGSFYEPPTEADRIVHRQSLDRLTEQSVQQAVTNYTRATPVLSVRRGEHHQGPYVLITIHRDVENLPYVVLSRPVDRNNPPDPATDVVYIRKGSHTERATPEEIAALQRLAEMKRRMMAGLGN